jgi:hypothetical protein
VRALSRNEITTIIQEGKLISETDGTAILDQFERDQPQFYQAIFGPLSDGIAELDPDMANLFLDLCFDIILVYQKAFGKPPNKARGEDWFNKKISLLDLELKSISDDAAMSARLKKRLSDRFVKRSIEAGVQWELLQYLDEQVKNYATFKSSRTKAIHITNNLLFVVVRLMDDIYSSEK